jgi:AraC-like DNA-binding protein/mannose-6-phosphate isomerase-like protein (cupin superfamily)
MEVRSVRLQIETYNGANCLLSDLAMAGRGRFPKGRHNTLPAHLHVHAYEICYVAEGYAEWWAEKDEYKVHGGQFYVTRPGEVHGGVANSPFPTELYWIQVAFPAEGALTGLTVDETRRLEVALAGIGGRQFDASSDPRSAYDQMLASMRRPSALGIIQLRAALHNLLVQVVVDAPGTVGAPMKGERVSKRVKAAQAWIDARLGDDFSVTDVARESGMASSQFHKLFGREVGMSPGEYRTFARIAAAKERLSQTSESITGISFDLGFSSSQYFATVFKSMTGMTPRRYRVWSRDPDPLGRLPVYAD